MSVPWLLAAMLLGAGNKSCTGERVEAVVHDATTRRDWLRMRDCAHPEWPAHLQLDPIGQRLKEPLGYAEAKALPAPIVVKAGMPVTVWQDGTAHIRLSGVAAQSAPIGGEIVVRLGSGWLLRGVVRGPGSVELSAPAGWSRP
ncbi:flagella basal body P-ring formation protein FlgA [Silvibacterium dinghuense]|uniref:Flagella basal body P-ring formation protein FlgA SAF domain-containing protein n=1 Tax=Silvibacterium dinghuense TaxID=1560006 RepID=A0A4Q1SEG1_9BACT|nr:flagella basal body P-ring formation protein FlgA [Silvibacterium dinghuense]RXS95652.1 hypothetical protein ESZ00_13940 [Silvibacterium dinghuense]GGH14706.1 hypothetical protein GCM10011586_35300 [Silvibacterium dinghuense]